MAEVVLGVTGGIAAYKSIDVLRILQRRGHVVRVVMTPAATRFVGPATFAALSGGEVGLTMFAREERPGYHHLDLMSQADVLVVAPATANTIARMAHGMADDLLSSCYLAFPGPVVLAPAMNTKMYEHPATRANLQALRERGAGIVAPESGLLADGDVGVGRLAAPSTIADAVEMELGSGDLAGSHVLITAGGTQEPIDSVRFLGNRSSGKMGFAIADAAKARGAEVTVIAANVALPQRADVTYVEVGTADELRTAARGALESADIVIMAAAVADYRATAKADGKIDKSAAASLTLELERTTDILSELAALRSSQVLVGFAAEHGEDGLERARAKRARKGVDLLVHNDVSVAGIGFGADE
ncbi:MAG: bifunctional phosphopantothenoylcysteine decarboxylase/phosphopantothenate--cysteine ligase CoaBC, partial [Thermoleophilia bacterium]|nr:bifunctional phosphopantothenoylcysteine decarboxylase/phosphopantothenate--cysteine ligase CoaBC [Thermoleophilia bacterium]